MFRISRSVSRSSVHFKNLSLRVPVCRYSVESSDPVSGKKGSVIWKLLGISLTGVGGVIGYAWYDSNFKKNVEDVIPYSSDAFNVLFTYLPPPPKTDELKKKIEQLPSLIKKQDAVPPPTKPVDEPVKLVESKKETAEREAREKKEKAKELLRRREEEENAQNAGLEKNLETLQEAVSKAVSTATSAHHLAAQAVRTHVEQLKKAMQEGSTEMEWEQLTESHPTLEDSVWSADLTIVGARESLENLRQAVTSGKVNAVTKRNKALSMAEKVIKDYDKELSSAIAELSRANAEAKKLSDYRDLVKAGKEQFRKEMAELGTDIKQTSDKTDLNSLIAHAHRRIDQLQKQLIELQALEPVRVQAALDTARDELDRLTDVQIAEEREKASFDLGSKLESWEAEARAAYETKLRQQLAQQSAAHSDHLVSVLRSQRSQLITEFESQLASQIEEEKYRLEADVAGLTARMKAIETAVDARAESERATHRNRELWLAARNLLAIVKEGVMPASTSTVPAATSKPVHICCNITDIKKAGAVYPMVHMILESIPATVRDRGVYTPDVLTQRFHRVHRIARRVAMINDESKPTLGRYVLSYIQSFFVLRSARVSAATEIPTDASAFLLLDAADDCLRRGDFEQAVRYVNALRGEPRRVAADWLQEARYVLETRQAAEFLMTYAAAGGIGSVE